MTLRCIMPYIHDVKIQIYKCKKKKCICHLDMIDILKKGIEILTMLTFRTLDFDSKSYDSLV